MNQNLTDITLVVDRSGSMQSCRDDSEGGINSFIQEQAKEPGDALLTLVQFDTEYDFVHTAVLIKNVPEYNLIPRGMTALYDALGRAINETGARLAAMNEDDRPGLVVFAIVTDGAENSSREFNKAQIKEMIERQTKQWNWKFTYLGANQDSFGEASAMGISAASTLDYDASHSRAAYASLSGSTSRMRSAVMSAMPVIAEFTDEERTQAKAGEKTEKKGWFSKK